MVRIWKVVPLDEARSGSPAAYSQLEVGEETLFTVEARSGSPAAYSQLEVGEETLFTVEARSGRRRARRRRARQLTPVDDVPPHVAREPAHRCQV